VAAVVDAELSMVVADDEESAADEAVDVAVLMPESTVGVVEATGAGVVLDADVVADVSGALEAVSGAAG
jgi:hypothetical protein